MESIIWGVTCYCPWTRLTRPRAFEGSDLPSNCEEESQTYTGYFGESHTIGQLAVAKADYYSMCGHITTCTRLLSSISFDGMTRTAL